MMDLSSMKLLYIDETSSKKSHNYVTMVCDQDRLIIFICEGKSSETVVCLAVWPKAHNGKRDNTGFIVAISECRTPRGYAVTSPTPGSSTTSPMPWSSSSKPWTTQPARLSKPGI